MDEVVPTDAELWRQSERLRALARALVGDAGLGEDLAQEAWVAALRRPGAAPESVAAWLSGTVRHLARRLGQRERQRVDVERRAARPEAVEGPEEAVLRAEALQELGRAVLALEEPYRSAVILRHLDQLEPDEIARRQGCSRVAARQRVARGIAELRRRLDREHGGRERWSRALLPLVAVRPGTGVGTLVAEVGGIAMAVKWLVVGGGLLALLGLLWWQRGGASSSDPRAGRAPVRTVLEPASGAVPDEGRQPRTREELSGTPAQAGEGPRSQDPLTTRLEVRVRDAHGAPVRDAEVVLRRPELRGFVALDKELSVLGEVFARARSDEHGACALELAHSWPVDVRAEHEGYGQAVAASRFAGQRVELTLRPRAHLFGRVTRELDHRPVAGATLRVTRSDGSGQAESFEVVTDASGSYELFLPAGGQVVLSVLPRIEQAREGVPVVFADGNELELDLTVVEGLTVEGQVTDARTGLPIAGALVGESWAYRRATTTDAGGNYRFTGFGASGAYGLRARAEGFAEVLDYPSVVDARTRRLDFALVPAHAAFGRVLDERGEPVAGAYVAGVGRGVARKLDWRAGRTDLDGRFRVVGLDPGSHHALLVHHFDFAAVYYDFPLSEATDPECDLGDILLPPPGSLGGRVLDEQGAAVPLAHVELIGTNRDRRSRAPESTEPETADSYVGVRRIDTDEEGRFWIGNLAAGDYRVSVVAAGRKRTPPLEVVLERAGDSREVELVFPTGATLRGRVEDERGVGLADVLVRAASEDPDPAARTYAQTRSGSDGTFRVNGLSPGSYSLSVMPFDLPPTDDPCRPWLYVIEEHLDADGPPVTLVLRRGVCIEGLVLDADGQPMYGCQLDLRNGSGEPGLGTSTDSEGRFRLPVEPDTTWTITVRGPKGATAFDTLLEAPGIVAGTRGLELRLPR